MKISHLGLLALAAVIATPASAQWQVPNGAVPLGRGAGVTGFATATGSLGAGARCLTDTTPPSFAACPPGTGAALTRTNDTNVTATLGGSPTNALLQATSITLGWTGTLSAARGGFGLDASAQSGVPLFATGVPTFTGTTGSGNFARATSPAFVTPSFSSIVNTGTLTLPTSTDTLVGRATTDTLTNKTFDTAGTGNVFRINGVAISAVTGTGANVLAVSPALTGTPTAPTAANGTNTTQLATTQFVQSAVVASTTGVASIAGNTGAFTLGTGLSNNVNSLINTGVVTVKRQVFTSSGTYTPSAGMIYADIECIGGGGAGGGASSATGSSHTGGGGGAGARSVALVTAASVGASKAVTIGSGATGSTGNGASGAASSVATLCTANGGTGGTAGINGVSFGGGGSGGTSGIGTVAGYGMAGGSGGIGTTTIYVPSGVGGSTVYGSGGVAVVTGNNANGNTALGFGAGGGGALSYNTSTSATGGNGSSGVVVITEYCSQ